MNSGIRKLKLSIFTRLLLGFLVVLLPLYLFSIQINIWGQNDVRREIAESTKSRIDFFLNMLEEEVAKVIKAQRNLINDQDLQQLSIGDNQLDDYGRTRAVLSLQSKLRGVKEISRYIGDVYVYIPLINRKISSNSISVLPLDELSRLNSGKHFLEYPITSNDGEVYTSILSSNLTVVCEGTVYPSFVLCIEFSKYELSKVLRNFNFNQQGGALLASGKNGLNIVDAEQEAILPFVRDVAGNHAIKLDEAHIGLAVIGKARYIVTYRKSSLLNSTLLFYSAEKNYLSALRIYRTWLWIVSGVTLVLISTFSLMLRRIIARPLKVLVGAFRKVANGELDFKMSYHRQDEFGFIYRRFNEMCQQLKELIEHEYEHRILIQNSELKQLQLQINPHFLYNSLYSIYRMAKIGDIDTIAHLTEHLSNYYRFITRNSSDEVPLFLEVSHAKDYIEVQSVRFSGRIEATISKIPDGYEEFPVPRLTLQPFIENAYHYAFKSKLEGGILRIHFTIAGGFLHIHIEDNGDEMSEEKLEQLRARLEPGGRTSEITGMVNVHRRLQIRYGSDSGILLRRNEMGGLSLDIRIALEGGNQPV